MRFARSAEIAFAMVRAPAFVIVTLAVWSYTRVAGTCNVPPMVTGRAVMFAVVVALAGNA